MSSTNKVLVPTIKLPVTIEQAVSAKTGNPYNRMIVEFGDYKYTSFLREEQVILTQMKLEKAGLIEDPSKLDLNKD